MFLKYAHTTESLSSRLSVYAEALSSRHVAVVRYKKSSWATAKGWLSDYAQDMDSRPTHATWQSVWLTEDFFGPPFPKCEGQFLA